MTYEPIDPREGTETPDKDGKFNEAQALGIATGSAALSQGPHFGRLEAVPLRNYWRDEAREFTPWLAREENLTLLGDAIGMSLELKAVEHYIGPFRADIIAKDEDVEVIIENQLEATDHKHLGQLLVYAANRGAGVVVWVARQVSDEYRKVIDWLNEKTDVSFFALEVELWRIGDSPVAPKFNIVCEPNEFVRAVRPQGGGVSETEQLQLEFWTGLLEYMGDGDSSFNLPKIGARNWCDLRIGTSRGHIGLTASRNGRLSCELYLSHSQSDFLYEALERERDALEAELALAGELDWQPLPDKKVCRIALYKDIGALENRDRWQEAYKWMLDWAEKFKNTFAQRLKDIVLPHPEASGIDGHAATGDTGTSIPGAFMR